jgi:hypothetical protein
MPEVSPVPTWIQLVDERGQFWRLNQTGLALLTRQSVYNRLIRSRTRLEHVGCNPERVQLNTDFHGIVQDTLREAGELLTNLEDQIQRDPAQALRSLIELRGATSADVSYVRRLQQDASHQTWHNIEAAVHRGEVGVQVATQVRNLSVSTLVLASSVASGGTAVALLGAGSALNGVAQYQDTGSVSNAVLTATGTFATGFIPIAGAPGSIAATASLTTRVVADQAARSSERVALIFVGAAVDSTFTVANGLIQGSNVEPTLRAAGMRAGIDLASGMVGMRLDRLAAPVCVRLATDQMLDTAARVVGAGQSSGGGSGGPGGARGTVRGSSAPANTHAQAFARARPLFSGPVCDADSTLSTGDCSAEQWVDQIVLHREEW